MPNPKPEIATPNLSGSQTSSELGVVRRFDSIWATLAVLSAELGLAFVLGWGLTGLKLGGLAWMFAGIFAAGLVFQGCRWVWATTPLPNRRARKVGLALVGLTIGCSISRTDLHEAITHLPIYGLLAGLLLVSGCSIGYLYAHLRAHAPSLDTHSQELADGLDSLTPAPTINYLEALFATVPGGVGVMASLAADYGCNVTQVALVQILRITSVIILIPLLAGLGSGQGLNPRRLLPQQDGFVFTPQSIALLLVALLFTVVMVKLVQQTRTPAAPFLGGLVAGGLLNPLLMQGLQTPILADWLDPVVATNFSPPLWVGYVGQILLGLTIGEYWASHLGQQRRWQGYELAQALLCVGLTLATGFAGAAIAYWLTPWDWLTCLLVTAPGGAPEMILVAMALHLPIETITAGHVVRQISINSSLPLWLWLAEVLNRRQAQKLQEQNVQSLKVTGKA
jgi:uncharacterized protein